METNNVAPETVKTPKKKRTGLTVLIVILAVLILIPVGAFVFLSLSQFPAQSVPPSYYVDMPYSGSAEFSPDGTVSVELKQNDIYWLAHMNGIESALESLPEQITLSDWWFEYKMGSIDIYANGKAFGFVPLSVKLSADVSVEGERIIAKPTKVMLGNGIEMKAEELYHLGLQPQYEKTFADIGLPTRSTKVDFEESSIRVTEQLPATPFEIVYAGTRRTAFEAYTYAGKVAERIDPNSDLLSSSIAEPRPVGRTNPLFLSAIDKTSPNLKGDAIFKQLTSAEDIKDAINRFLGMCDAHTVETEFEIFNEFENHFIFTGTTQEQQAYRDEYLKFITEGQRNYETILSGLRERYKKLEFTLDDAGLIDNATGAPVVLSAFGYIFDETSRVILLHSLEAAQTVKTHDMPVLENVPMTSKKVIGDKYDKIPYDLAIVLKLENGAPAIIYYQGNGCFIVNYVPEEFYNDFMTREGLIIYASDDLPLPPTRGVATRKLADDLCDYYILYPEM